MAQPVTADFARLVDDLINRQPIRPGRLTMLSELDADARRELGGRWQEIPADVRETLVQQTAELADAQLGLDFDELARIALQDSEPEIRIKAIESLWESVNPAVAEDLTAALGIDTEEAVRAAAASSLGTFVLAREFEDIDEALGDRVVTALRTSVEDAAEPVNVRGAALESIAGRSLPWVAGLISDAYYDDDRELRLSALRAMGTSADVRWLDMLTDDLTSSDADVRLEATSAVGEIGEEDGVDLIAPLLEDEDRDVILATLNALANIAGDEAMAVLRQFSREVRDPELRDAARAAQDMAAILNGEEDDEAQEHEDDDDDEDDADDGSQETDPWDG